VDFPFRGLQAALPYQRGASARPWADVIQPIRREGSNHICSGIRPRASRWRPKGSPRLGTGVPRKWRRADTSALRRCESFTPRLSDGWLRVVPARRNMRARASPREYRVGQGGITCSDVANTIKPPELWARAEHDASTLPKTVIRRARSTLRLAL
jgi:hypothetical protein